MGRKKEKKTTKVKGSSGAINCLFWSSEVRRDKHQRAADATAVEQYLHKPRGSTAPANVSYRQNWKGPAENSNSPTPSSRDTFIFKQTSREI